MKLLCLFSRLLGGNTFTRHLVEVINSIPRVTPKYLFHDTGDYSTYPARPICRLSNTLESASVIKQKYRQTITGAFDLLFFQSYTLLLPFTDLVKRLPTAVALDTTPKLARHLTAQASGSSLTKAKHLALGPVGDSLFRRSFRSVQLFLPRTSWCAQSLVRDYRISPSRIHVTYSPVDLSLWRPMSKRSNDKLRLLFVANDFYRKGGQLLLRLFEQYLSDVSTLHIVSNDPILVSQRLPKGVEVIHGLSHANPCRLAAIYQTSDLFVFPTRKDQLGLVLTEALAAGLPVIATDVGGVRELVIDNVNGYLMPYDSTAEEWAFRILTLARQPSLLRYFATNSRRLAETLLSPDRFRFTINNVIDNLISTAESNRSHP